MAVDQAEEPDPHARAEVMGPLSKHGPGRRYDQAVVAGCAGRGLEILPHCPGYGVHVPLMVLREKNVPVLALLIHIPRRNIRLFMALGAGIGLAGNFDRKRVARMAGRACPETAVGIFPAHALVRPVRQIRHLISPDETTSCFIPFTSIFVP